MADNLTLKIDTKDLEKLLKRFPSFEAIIFEEINAAMHGGLAIFQEQVQGRTPVGVSGDLRKSIMPVVRGTPQNLQGELVTSLVYGEPVERGREPGKWPPIDAIELWVQRKLGIGPDESRSVAFLIARKIGTVGTQGAFMFEKGFEAGKSAVEKLWALAPEKAARRIEAELNK